MNAQPQDIETPDPHQLVANLEAELDQVRQRIATLQADRPALILATRGGDPEAVKEARQALAAADTEAEQLRLSRRDLDDALILARRQLADLEDESAEAARAAIDHKIETLARRRRKRCQRLDTLLRTVVDEITAMEDEGCQIRRLSPNRGEFWWPLHGTEFKARAKNAIMATLFGTVDMGLPAGADPGDVEKFTFSNLEEHVHKLYLSDGNAS